MNTTLQILADPETGTLDDIVDVDRYPLHEHDGPPWAELVRAVRHELDRDGVATLPGFLRPEALATAAEEIARVTPYVAIRRHDSTVYHRAGPVDAPDDPRNVQSTWIAGHVTRDMIPPYAVGHRLYAAAAFKRFVAACVGRDRVFEYADPLAGLVATVIPPGGQYPWHYDTNEFVVTIMTQAPAAGGRFEYVQDLRTPGDENLAGLGRVLTGDRSSVRSIQMVPGDLQLFLGRYSLHQITPVEGDLDRHVLVCSYAERPGVIGPTDRTRSVYGRVTEAHLLAEQFALAANDGLIL